MASKSIVLITGGNAGIGYEVVKALLRSDRQYHILLAGRDIKKAEDAAKSASSEIESKSILEPIQVDVEEDESISKAFDQVKSKHPKIDCLINNAGASFDPQIANGNLTARQGWMKTWNVNVAGAYVMTETFLPLLLKSEDPRLLFVTSGLSSISIAADTTHPRYQNPPAGYPKENNGQTSYKSSKAGLNMMMVEWQRILKNDGVKVWSIAPGLLATGLGGDREFLKKIGAKDPSIGGTVIRNVVEGKRDGETGQVVREYDSPVQPW